jgi:hypothetical protein
MANDQTGVRHKRHSVDVRWNRKLITVRIQYARIIAVIAHQYVSGRQNALVISVSQSEEYQERR